MKRSIKSIINKDATIKPVNKLQMNNLKGGSIEDPEWTGYSIEDPEWEG